MRIRKQSGCAAGVDPHHRVVRAEPPGTRQADQPSHALAGIDRVEGETFQPGGEVQRLLGRGIRQAVARAAPVARNLYRGIVPAVGDADQRRSFVPDATDVGCNSRRLRVDIDADHPRRMAER